MRFEPGSDEARMLEAMCRARFTLMTVLGRHPAAGLIFRDLGRKEEHWLVDEGLEKSMPDGISFVTRFLTPDRFSMTAGVSMPATRELLKAAVGRVPYLERKPLAELFEDRRFAEAVYAEAIASCMMERVRFEDPPEAGYAD